jgi:saccharopine dehydrogenase-like NADP-dependent oxidoreductase
MRLKKRGKKHNRIAPHLLCSSGESTVVKPCYTAMAKCVGFPAGIAAKMILDKEIQKRGMVYPFSADIYKPMLMR